MRKTHAMSTVMKERILQVQRSLRVLFPAAAEDPFLSALDTALRAMTSEDPVSAATALNDLAATVEKTRFRAMLDKALIHALLRVSVPFQTRNFNDPDSDESFFLDHAKKIAASLETLFPDFVTAHTDLAGLIRPSVRKYLTCGDSIFLKLKTPAILMECLKQYNRTADIFSGGRFFRHDNGNFIRIDQKDVRSVDAFYGYRSARQTFLDHFGAFAAGKSNLPLLISSLPGLGKTRMTISHSLHYPEIILILASPRDLSHGLEKLIRTLEQFPQHRFMVFFDDIDVPQMDWYDFRTQVGGAFTLPENISFTIAANQQFPANISSRGRGFLFPIFDEIRCQEMIEDFLISCGMHQPSPELISVIAADYVESFGQKFFEELSPRTLVRYLESYRTDGERRKRMLDSARHDVIPRPDPQVFYDENLKLMRAIYGDSILDEIHNRELGVKK